MFRSSVPFFLTTRRHEGTVLIRRLSHTIRGSWSHVFTFFVLLVIFATRKLNLYWLNTEASMKYPSVPFLTRLKIMEGQKSIFFLKLKFCYKYYVKKGYISFNGFELSYFWKGIKKIVHNNIIFDTELNLCFVEHNVPPWQLPFMSKFSRTNTKILI